MDRRWLGGVGVRLSDPEDHRQSRLRRCLWREVGGTGHSQVADIPDSTVLSTARRSLATIIMRMAPALHLLYLSQRQGAPALELLPRCPLDALTHSCPPANPVNNARLPTKRNKKKKDKHIHSLLKRQFPSTSN